ncbi:hypothetical protein GF415_04240 [Candidatus Micrarchaeota archaeon]|nr:hypothetical protein [Candidatus Micrarchaeota archaeon]
MASEKGNNNVIKKIEKTSLQKFKNQNKILKKFGKPGLKVYRAINKAGTKVEELIEKTGIGQKKLFEILIFLKKNKMVETVGKVAEEKATEEKKPETGKERIGPKKKKKAAAKKPGKKAKKEAIEPKEGIMPPEPLEEPEEKPKAKKKGAVAKPGPKKKKKAAAKKPKKPPAMEITPEEEFGVELPEEEEIAPLELEEEEPEKIPEPKEEPPEELEEEEKISPYRKNKKPEEPEEDEEDIFLTPGERKIKKKYGETGIDVYNLIDGQRTAEQIMRETGVTEKKLIEMLDFMENKGIIKLEHPERKRKKKKAGVHRKKVKDVGFAPMLEEGVSPQEPIGGKAGKEFVLEIPEKTGRGAFREIQMKANLMIKFKRGSRNVIGLINGSRDAVEIALKTGLPLYKIYKILEYLEKEGFVKLRASTRKEIKRKYGDDGYSVYKKYGREGVMLYQLIGKDMDMAQMAWQTSENNERVVKIFMFIHRLLGIELPIDEDVLLERLERKE